MPRPMLVAAALFVAIATPALAQQPMGYREDPKGKDELWEVQTTMEMQGMRMAMPGGPNKVCIEKGRHESGAPVQGDCKVLESKQVGSRFVYKMACKDARSDYVVDGDTTWSGDRYDGTMRMSGTMEGRPADMKMSYAGKRLGNCVSTIRQDIAKMEADSKAQGDKYCADMMDRFYHPVFEQGSACAGKRKEFSAALTRASTDMRDPVQFVAYTKKNPDMKTAFAAYNLDWDATAKAACGRAGETRNYAFIGSGNCDSDVLAKGKGVCDRRDRSPDEEYRPMCARYATLTRGRGGSEDSGSSASAPSKSAPRAPTPADGVQQGLDAVRKLLPF